MRHHDLLVVGAGSGNMVLDDGFSHLDVALVTDKDFGGTCLNAGCIPSKMLARTADVADTVRDAARFDVDADLRSVRWRSLRDRVFGRLDRISADGRKGREDTDWITVYQGHASFTGERRLRIGPDTEITADRIVIAAGSRPVIPPPVADSGLPYETSDTVMRTDRAPQRLAVLGGGYIAAELAHVFAAAGTEVSIVEQADVLLSGQDDDVCRAFTARAADRFDLHLGRSLTELAGEPGRLRLVLDDGTVLEADQLLVAAGRKPNGDRMDLPSGGVDVHEDGRIRVDDHQRATAPGVWALGDVCTPVPLKHVANREAEVVRHNLQHPDDLVEAGHDVIPAAVFADPQVATVGATERELRAAARPHVVGTARYADVAYGWALQEDDGFCKVLAEPGTGKILGAHIIGPDASMLIHPLVMAMSHGIDARALAGTSYWIHPALTELVENALLDLDLDQEA